LFEATWETLQQFNKRSGMIAVFLRAAIEHPHLHCIVPGGGGQRGAMEKIVEVIVSKGFIESFRAKFCETQNKKAYKIRANKTRDGRNLGGFAKKPFGLKVCGGIFG
jgi:hypothetical protein